MARQKISEKSFNMLLGEWGFTQPNGYRGTLFCAVKCGTGYVSKNKRFMYVYVRCMFHPSDTLGMTLYLGNIWNASKLFLYDVPSYIYIPIYLFIYIYISYTQVACVSAKLFFRHVQISFTSNNEKVKQAQPNRRGCHHPTSRRLVEISLCPEGESFLKK